MGGSFGLASRDRVRRRAEFERAYNEGARIRARFMTIFVVPNAFSYPRLGIAASRRLGTAVIRNRAKRLTRELFRRHKIGSVWPAASGLDVVVVPRREMVDAPFASLEADYATALERGRSTRATSRVPDAVRRRPGAS